MRCIGSKKRDGSLEVGNLVQVRRYLGAVHGFFTMPGTLRLERQALGEVAAFL